MVYVKVVDGFTNLVPGSLDTFSRRRTWALEITSLLEKSKWDENLKNTISFHVTKFTTKTLQDIEDDQSTGHALYHQHVITYLIIYFRMQRLSTYSFLLGKCDILLAFCYILKVRKDLWILRL